MSRRELSRQGRRRFRGARHLVYGLSAPSRVPPPLPDLLVTRCVVTVSLAVALLVAGCSGSADPNEQAQSDAPGDGGVGLLEDAQRDMSSDAGGVVADDGSQSEGSSDAGGVEPVEAAQFERPCDTSAAEVAADVEQGVQEGQSSQSEIDPVVTSYAGAFSGKIEEAQRRLVRRRGFDRDANKIVKEIRELERSRFAGSGKHHKGGIVWWICLTGDDPPSEAAALIAGRHDAMEIRTGASHTDQELEVAQLGFGFGQEAGISHIVTGTGINTRANAINIHIGMGVLCDLEPAHRTDEGLRRKMNELADLLEDHVDVVFILRLDGGREFGPDRRWEPGEVKAFCREDPEAPLPFAGMWPFAGGAFHNALLEGILVIELPCVYVDGASDGEPWLTASGEQYRAVVRLPRDQTRYDPDTNLIWSYDYGPTTDGDLVSLNGGYSGAGGKFGPEDTKLLDACPAHGLFTASHMWPSSQ